MADLYEYNDIDVYRSVLSVKPGKVKIIFDPTKLPHAGTQDLPQAVFEKPYQYLGKALGITTRFDQQYQKFQTALQTYRENRGNPLDFIFDNTGLSAFLEDIMRHEQELPVAAVGQKDNICKPPMKNSKEN